MRTAIWLPLLLACQHEPVRAPSPPPAIPAKPAAATISLPCVEEPPAGHVRGVMIQRGADGRPRIVVGLFREVNREHAGQLKFDLSSLSKLKGTLEQSTQLREFSMRIENSAYGTSPDIDLDGTYKLVQVLPGAIEYEDLVETDWDCDLPHLESNKPSGTTLTKCSSGELSMTGAVDWSSFDAEAKNLKELVASGSRPASSDEDRASYAQIEREYEREMRKAFDEAARKHREIGAELGQLQKDYLAAWKKCDPTGKAHVAWTVRDRGYRSVTVLVTPFTPSNNPLYPAPTFHNAWRPADQNWEKVKNGFQIKLLVEQQIARSGG